MGQSTSRQDFEWSTQPEPHKSRRIEILKKHPEIKQLFVVDPLFKWKVTAVVLFQFATVYLFQELPGAVLFLLAYALGGTFNHSLMLAVHEISHSQAFGYNAPLANRMFGLFANLPIGVPIASSFKKYHLLHHRYQGDNVLDTDLPTVWEGQFFRSPIMKTLWLILQPGFYALRPFFVHPVPITHHEVLNITVQFSFNYAVYHFFGLHMLLYLVGGSLLSMGLHPMAGHFIAEHFLWAGKDAETYSYYGPLNLIAWNVGYHVAHHDFPSVPGALLPQIERIAPEFYKPLPSHQSWSWCLYEFITNPEIGPFTRVKRVSAQKTSPTAGNEDLE